MRPPAEWRDHRSYTAGAAWEVHLAKIRPSFQDRAKNRQDPTDPPYVRGGFLGERDAHCLGVRSSALGKITVTIGPP